MLRSVKESKEIVVVAQNRIGIVSEVVQVLAAHRISLKAISAQAAGGVGLINCVTDQHGEAVALLLKKGYRIYENRVVLGDLRDRPGALQWLTRKLALKKINLASLYATATAQCKCGYCLVVFSCNDNKKATAYLKTLIK